MKIDISRLNDVVTIVFPPEDAYGKNERYTVNGEIILQGTTVDISAEKPIHVTKEQSSNVIVGVRALQADLPSFGSYEAWQAAINLAKGKMDKIGDETFWTDRAAKDHFDSLCRNYETVRDSRWHKVDEIEDAREQAVQRVESDHPSVSYTHLTLPTN